MKFSGEVGFWTDEMEVNPGVWRGVISERHYVGDVLRDNRRFQPSSDQQNDEFTVSNKISILSDMYAKQNWASIRYVRWNGVKFKVTSVEVGYPRLTLEIGGIYNGEDQINAPQPIEGVRR